ncbi:hypothetical protein BH20ACT5_BH20ACT5_06800 [soil metagenome]
MRAAAALLVLVAALELAVLQVFLLPLRIGSVPVPLSIALAVAGNIGLTQLAYRVTRSRLLAALPMLAWLVVVIGFAVPRPEGDVIVSGSPSNIAYLGLGVCAAAYALGRVLATPARPSWAAGGSSAPRSTQQGMPSAYDER